MNEQGTELRTQRLAADADGIRTAARLIADGACVAVPTETVYGLAADATNPAAVAAIYAAKGRPSINPLIVHVPNHAAARRLVDFTPQSEALADAFWPGPLTLVLPRRPGSGIADLASAGLPTLAVRVPAHPVMQALLAETGLPLAAPSANASGRLSPTCAEHVLASLAGRIPAVLDGGPSICGLESTIVGFVDATPVLLRPGGLPAAVLEAVLGVPLALPEAGKITAPGQLLGHYAPTKPLLLNVTEPAADMFMIGFGAVAGHVSLSATGDLTQAAARLFAALHSADAHPLPRIAVAPIPAHGLGVAINDRLTRAVAIE